MKQFLLALLIACTARLNGQVAVSYFPFQDVLSLSSNPDRLLWADLGAETNTFFSNVNFEASCMLNLRRNTSASYYCGAGISVNPFFNLKGLQPVNGYALKIGTRIKPFKDHRGVQLVFEISPYVNSYLDGGLLRTMLGIAYNFSGQKKAD